MLPPPASRCGRRSSSERKRRRTNAKTPTAATTAKSTRDDDATGRRTSKRSRRSRRTRSPIDRHDENSIGSCSTLNTAFVDIDDDTVAKWRPDLSAVLPAGDVVRRRTTEAGLKPEVEAAVRQVALCERTFVDDVGDVICRLSRPLLRRRDIVTSRQHCVLFQNLEKVRANTLVVLQT